MMTSYNPFHQFQIKLRVVLLFCCPFLHTSAQQNKPLKTLTPVIDGEWWEVTGNPDVGKYTAEKQQPVDFGVWQAADGTWQLWSCIRGTKAGGRGRLFYCWEGKQLTDHHWTPKGIAMEADTLLGEEKAGLQAPFVLKEGNKYLLFYGDWNRICLAESKDGKKFHRVLHDKHNPALFSGPLYNTRDPMVLKINNTYYCYYSGHLEEDNDSVQVKSAVFCRTSTDLRTWSAPVIVSTGGLPAKQKQWYGGDSECPFVVQVKNQFILFRTHKYGEDNLNTQYASTDPLRFGIGNDEQLIGQLSVAAPEIVKFNDQYYIFALKPTLDGIRAAKLKFIAQ